MIKIKKSFLLKKKPNNPTFKMEEKRGKRKRENMDDLN